MTVLKWRINLWKVQTFVWYLVNVKIAFAWKKIECHKIYSTRSMMVMVKGNEYYRKYTVSLLHSPSTNSTYFNPQSLSIEDMVVYPPSQIIHILLIPTNTGFEWRCHPQILYDICLFQAFVNGTNLSKSIKPLLDGFQYTVYGLKKNNIGLSKANTNRTFLSHSKCILNKQPSRICYII